MSLCPHFWRLDVMLMFLLTALVSIYTKCGNFKDAFDNFNFVQEAGVEPGSVTSSVAGRRKMSSCTDPKIQIWLRYMVAKCAHRQVHQMQQSQGGYLKGFMVCEKCECTLSKVRELMDMFHQMQWKFALLNRIAYICNWRKTCQPKGEARFVKFGFDNDVWVQVVLIGMDA